VLRKASSVAEARATHLAKAASEDLQQTHAHHFNTWAFYGCCWAYLEGTLL
jgi:hypothetical protein